MQKIVFGIVMLVLLLWTRLKPSQDDAKNEENDVLRALEEGRGRINRKKTRKHISRKGARKSISRTVTRTRKSMSRTRTGRSMSRTGTRKSMSQKTLKKTMHFASNFKNDFE